VGASSRRVERRIDTSRRRATSCPSALVLGTASPQNAPTGVVCAREDIESEINTDPEAAAMGAKRSLSSKDSAGAVIAASQGRKPERSFYMTPSRTWPLSHSARGTQPAPPQPLPHPDPDPAPPPPSPTPGAPPGPNPQPPSGPQLPYRDPSPENPVAAHSLRWSLKGSGSHRLWHMALGALTRR